MKYLSTLTAMVAISLFGTVGCASPTDEEDLEQSAESTADLSATVAPGGNFDLSVWDLQEPVGSPGHPTTIKSSQLRGPNGFQDKYFYTDSSDGSMTFWDPENGVTTPNSHYSRSELREMNSNGSAANWNPLSGNHTLSATVKVSKVPSNVCVGQIHLGTGTPASTKPLVELYYHSNGDIVVGIERSPSGGQDTHTIGHVSLGTKWSYVIGLSGHSISITINGGSAKKYTMASSFDKENMYFKAGNYIQSSGSSSTVGSLVHFYALRVNHN
ncbi:polysaccharide lyase family 7 protein [Pendulispora rubella]|uniref:Polysaccharide lyase family 7 protein n=1 Tax=Pendulispora rubella TaxID=2741070 RepID=A0ABZ2L7V9_9BACT